MKRFSAKLHFDVEAVANIVPALVLICTSVFAYGLCGPHIGWLSDDYAEVFGASSGVPDWRTAFTIGGVGHWSPYRLLKYPLQGYLGFWLGPCYTHILQFMVHLFCVLLFYTLLKRLAWPTPASLAAGMLFSSSPWFSSAVYWWPAASATWATMLVLGAAHCFILWSESHLCRWLIAYASFVLLSLVLYELWLGGFIFFAGLDWYYRRIGKSVLSKTANGESSKGIRDSLWRYVGIAVPFLVYAVLYGIAPSADASERLSLTLTRLPALLAFVHLRVVQWPLTIEWRWTFLNASLAFHSAFGAFVLAAEAAVLLLLGYTWVCRVREIDLSHNNVPLWDSLVLGWSLFLGSRIVFILQGAIAGFDTRLNYAASMGVAVAVVALLWSLIQTKQIGTRLHAIAGVMVLAIVFVLGWASAGVGVHYVKTSKAEAQTIRALDRWISASPLELRGLTIVVVAAKNAIAHGTGEFAYFNEHDGYWLSYAIKRRCQDCDVFVTEEVECVGKRGTIVLHDPLGLTRTASKGRQVLGDGTVLFRWTGENLIFEGVACQ